MYSFAFILLEEVSDCTSARYENQTRSIKLKWSNLRNLLIPENESFCIVEKIGKATRVFVLYKVSQRLKKEVAPTYWDG